MAAFAALILVAGMILVFAVFGFTLSLVLHLVTGLLVGAVARLVLPGEERIGLFGTALIGMGGSMGGHVIGRALHLGEVMQFGLAVGVACVLFSVLGFRAR